MKGALTLAKLRGLAKLYRAEIEGAEEQLEALIQEHRDELPFLLGLTLEQVVRFTSQEHAVAALATAIDEASPQARAARASTNRDAAQLAASNLTAASIARSDGHYCLSVPLLTTALELWKGDGDVAFGHRGVVAISGLRALLRQDRDRVAISAVVTDTELVVAYRTIRSRGTIRWSLHARRPHDRVLDVDLGSAHALEATPNVHTPALQEPTPWPANDEQAATCPPAPSPPQRPSLEPYRHGRRLHRPRFWPAART